VSRPPDLGEIDQIHAVHAVEADYVMTEALQMANDRDTNVAAMPGDEKAHATMISLRSNWRMREPSDACLPSTRISRRQAVKEVNLVCLLPEESSRVS
jgi:hypothetical protein